MALKFRRGTTAQKSGSLAFGEPYVNTTLGTLQVGLDTGDITLATQGTSSLGQFGAISGSGLDITGNANIAGNLTLGGNITIGDATTDTVVINADLSSSIIPDTTNTFDVGSPTKIYRTIYGGIISGSVLEIMSGSNPEIRLLNKTTGIEYHIQNGDGGNFQIHNGTTGNLLFKFLSGSIADGNQDAFFYGNLSVSKSISSPTITGLNTFTGSASLRLTNLESATASLFIDTNNLEAFSASQLIKDNTLQSYTASIDTKFNTLATYTASIDSTIARLKESTASLNIFTASNANTSLNSYTSSNDTTNTNQNNRLSRLEESTASLNAFSASENTKSSTLQSYTASVDAKFAAVQASTSSLNAFSASNGNTSLNLYTASNDTTNTAQNTRLTRLEESTASLNAFSSSENNKSETLRLYTASVDAKFSTLATYTSSVDTTNTTQNNRLSRLEESTASINLTTASLNGHVTDINTWSASVKGHIVDINSYTSSLKTAITIAGSDVTLNGNLTVAGTTTTVNSTTVQIADNILELNYGGSAVRGGLLVKDATGTLSSGSFLWDAANDNWIAGASGSESKLLRAGGDNVVSSSSQIDATATTNWATGIKTQLNSNTVVSGSSQVNFTQLSGISANIISASTDSSNVDFIISGGSITANLFGGVVSGSAQITGVLTSLNSYTASNDTTNTLQTTRIDQIAAGTASVNTFSASTLTRFTRIEESTASLNAFSASENTKAATLQTYTSSVDAKFLTLQTLTASIAAQVTRLQESTASLNVFSASALTRFTRIEESTSSLNAFTSSQSTTNTNYANRFTRIEESTASLNAFSASENSKAATLQSYTASIDAKFSTLATYTGSNDTTNSTQNTRLTRIEESTSSLNTLTASLATTYEGRASATKVLVSGSSQVNFTQLSGISANIISGSTNSTNVNFTISGGSITANLIGGVVSGSAQVVGMLASLNTYTSSNDTTNTAQNTRLSRLEESTASLNSLTASYARTNSANVFTGNQTITGSLFITQDLIVGGSSSIQNISSSRLDIGDNIIQLNVNNPVLRFGGLAIFDSGSAGGSGSFLYDSVEDEFIFVHRGNGLNVTSSHFIMGPETYDNVGNETYLTNNRLPKGSGKEHLNDSNITDTGTLITLGSNTVVNGTIVASGTTLVSGSSQISHDSTTGYSANRHIDHTAVSITAGSGLTGGGDISATRTISIATGGVTDSMLAGSISNSKLTNSSITIAGQSTALGSSVTAETIRTAIGTVVTGSAQIDLTATTNYATGILTRLNTVGVFSGSSQVSHDSTTGYSANRHVDHTAVSITAGSGLTGGGDISTTRTISIANLGVTDAMLAGSISNAKLTNSAITIAGQSTSLGGSVTAETIRTAIGTVVTGSAQIAIASTSGFGTYINQAVLTTSSPTFAGLTINGAITATGDITAFFTSDKRHKNNIQIIPNALQKVSKLNGVTWEWNDDVNEVTKATPKTGLIAQDVQEVLPEVVREREDGFLSLDYSKMVGLLVEAIKEQQSQIHNLTLQVENLKKQKGL